MDKQLVSDVNLYTFDIDRIQSQYEELFEVIEDSIKNRSTSSLTNSLKKLMESFERTFNKLKISEERDCSIFYFGCIISISNLVIKIQEDNEEVKEFCKAIDNYPHLLPIIKYINMKKNASDKEIRNDLKITMSDLSNFIKKVDKYNFFIVKKVETTNYYQLTHKAERLYRSYKRRKDLGDPHELFSFESIISLLDCIINDLSNDVVSPVQTVLSCKSMSFSDDQIRILKKYIDKLYTMRTTFIS